MAPQLIIVFAVLLLAGCGHGPMMGPPSIQDPGSAATVIFVRPWHLVSGGASYVVTIDDVNVEEIYAGEHLIIRVPSGERIVGLVSWDPNVPFARTRPSVVLRAEPRVTYYFRIAHAQISRITESEGRKLVAETTEPSLPRPALATPSTTLPR